MDVTFQPRGDRSEEAKLRQEREGIRSGAYTGHTAGLAPGYVQANLVILPAGPAQHFLAYCQKNPKPCPLLAVSEVGDPRLPELGDIDVRTDIPRYLIFHGGAFDREATDITDLWRDDLVAFALGCSYSFEEALLEQGLNLRHIEQGTVVPMYRTNIDTKAAGPFKGKLVVSMRPFGPAEAIRAIQVTSRFPSVHGAPVHIGKPHLIGISDLNRPDWGDPAEVAEDEMPLFWACGVTPQVAIEQARPELCITHKPGHMLISDVRNPVLAVI